MEILLLMLTVMAACQSTGTPRQPAKPGTPNNCKTSDCLGNPQYPIPTPTPIPYDASPSQTGKGSPAPGTYGGGPSVGDFWIPGMPYPGTTAPGGVNPWPQTPGKGGAPVPVPYPYPTATPYPGKGQPPAPAPVPVPVPVPVPLPGKPAPLPTPVPLPPMPAPTPTQPLPPAPIPVPVPVPTAPPAAQYDGCSSEVLATNYTVTVGGVKFSRTATAKYMTGTSTVLSKFTNKYVTLSSGKGYSVNSITSPVIRNGVSTSNVTPLRFDNANIAWLKVDGVDIPFGVLSQSADGKARLDLINGVCVVQYGNLSGGFPWLVMP